MALYDNNPNTVVPKIRGDNPPLSRRGVIEAYNKKRSDLNAIAVLSGAILLIGILASMALESFGGVIMCILTGVGAYYAYFKDADTELKKEAEEVNRQVFLDAYTIEGMRPTNPG